MKLLVRYALTASLAFLVIVGIGTAQAEKGEKGEIARVSTDLSPTQRTAVLDYIKGEATKPSALPEFKVPAQSVILCGMQRGQFTCTSSPYGDTRCPEQIDFETPDGKMMNNIPVDCTGPDADGNCDCEFPKK